MTYIPSDFSTRNNKPRANVIYIAKREGCAVLAAAVLKVVLLLLLLLLAAVVVVVVVVVVAAAALIATEVIKHKKVIR
jgi:hypothetical protein